MKASAVSTATMTTRRRTIAAWTVIVTVLVEAVTVSLRFGGGLSAAEFNRHAPLLLQIHHIFWSIPLLVVTPFAWRYQRTSGALVGIALGFILSDAIHHLVVLPLMVGNTGWHWP